MKHNDPIVKAVKEFSKVQPLKNYSESIERIFRIICVNNDIDGLREDILKECPNLAECADFLRYLESLLKIDHKQ